MSLKICSIASGSSGNCIYVASDSTKILIDIGITLARVEESLARLKVNPADINAIIITHSHVDHICGVNAFVNKYHTETYCHWQSAAAFLIKFKKFHINKLIEFDNCDFFIGDMVVSPFAVKHDVPCSGFSFYCDGKKVSVATDLGIISKGTLDKMIGSDVVLLESNHDEQLLNQNVKYSAWLKKRILSSSGHLSNSACGEALAVLVRAGVRRFILGHLSQENNYPELVSSTIRDVLARYDLYIDEHLEIEVATFAKISSLFEIC